MGDNEKRRSMAHWVQAEHAKTRERLARRVVYPVPAEGAIIVYNENQKYHEKHDCKPERGLGIVSGVCGCNVIIQKMHMSGKFFTRAIRVLNFELGLYRYIELSGVPKECPVHAEMEILNHSGELDVSNLSDELKCLLNVRKTQDL